MRKSEWGENEWYAYGDGPPWYLRCRWFLRNEVCKWRYCWGRFSVGFVGATGFRSGDNAFIAQGLPARWYHYRVLSVDHDTRTMEVRRLYPWEWVAMHARRLWWRIRRRSWEC